MDQLFLLIKASDELIEQQAERLKYRKRLKVRTI